MSRGPHPSRCHCRGTGWTDGPPIPETINGRTHLYATVTLCQHDWWHDDTGYDPYHDEPIPRQDPRAQAGFAAGYTRALADLDTIRATPQEDRT